MKRRDDHLQTETDVGLTAAAAMFAQEHHCSQEEHGSRQTDNIARSYTQFFDTQSTASPTTEAACSSNRRMAGALFSVESAIDGGAARGGGGGGEGNCALRNARTVTNYDDDRVREGRGGWRGEEEGRGTLSHTPPRDVKKKRTSKQAPAPRIVGSRGRADARTTTGRARVGTWSGRRAKRKRASACS